MEFIKRIIEDVAQYQYSTDNVDPLDPKSLTLVKHTKAGEDYKYTDAGMFLLIGKEYGVNVHADFTFYSEYEDDSFGYSYGSENGTHTNFKGHKYTIENVQIMKYQYTDENGDDIQNPINILRVSGGIAALERAVEQTIIEDLLPDLQKYIDSRRNDQ